MSPLLLFGAAVLGFLLGLSCFSVSTLRGAAWVVILTAFCATATTLMFSVSSVSALWIVFLFLTPLPFLGYSIGWPENLFHPLGLRETLSGVLAFWFIQPVWLTPGPGSTFVGIYSIFCLVSVVTLGITTNITSAHNQLTKSRARIIAGAVVLFLFVLIVSIWSHRAGQFSSFLFGLVVTVELLYCVIKRRRPSRNSGLVSIAFLYGFLAYQAGSELASHNWETANLRSVFVIAFCWAGALHALMALLNVLCRMFTLFSSRSDLRMIARDVPSLSVCNQPLFLGEALVLITAMLVSFLFFTSNGAHLQGVLLMSLAWIIPLLRTGIRAFR